MVVVNVGPVEMMKVAQIPSTVPFGIGVDFDDMVVVWSLVKSRAALQLENVHFAMRSQFCSVAIDRYIASRDMVITEGRYTATARGTGARIDAPIAHVFTLSDVKVTNWRGYGDTAAVLVAHTTKTVSA